MKGYMKGNVDEELALGTLAATTAIENDFDDAVTERTLISSLVAIWSLSEATKGSGIGPIMVGVAHKDYGIVEIEEWIETTASWDTGSLKTKREIATRWIRRVGVFEMPASATESVTLNDGKPIKTKLNWMLQTDETLVIWAYNMGAVAFATTSPVVRLQGHANLWQK